MLEPTSANLVAKAMADQVRGIRSQHATRRHGQPIQHDPP
jgi:hypothetical protein